MVVYQEAESEADDAEVIVKIFVQFDKSSGERTRRLNLNFIVLLFHFISSARFLIEDFVDQITYRP